MTHAADGSTLTPYMGVTLAPLGEYYFPPKLLTAATMRSYVKLL